MLYIMKNRSNKTLLYSAFMQYKCANPDCVSGFNIQAHHIYPLSECGQDMYWNLVCLCSKCHGKYGKKRNNYKDFFTELFTWKTYMELEVWGFVLDEQADDFYANLKILVTR